MLTERDANKETGTRDGQNLKHSTVSHRTLHQSSGRSDVYGGTNYRGVRALYYSRNVVLDQVDVLVDEVGRQIACITHVM